MSESEKQNPAATCTDGTNSQTPSKEHPQITGHAWAQSISNVVVALATIAVVGVTSCYTHYAGQQAVLMQRSVDEIVKQSGEIKRSADAAENSAKAAKASAEVALLQVTTAKDANKLAAAGLESSRRDQRAWMAYGAVTLDKEPTADGDTIKVTLPVQNIGKSPASNMTCRSRLVVGPNPQAQPIWSTVRAENPTTLFPGVTNVGMSFDTERLQLTLPVVTAYRNGASKIYVWAYISYRDIFGVEHWTQACKYHVLGMAMNSFTECDSGNETDKR
jgi:hypothetical protein